MDLERVAELASWVSSGLFIALAFVALRVNRRQGDAASKWLVVCFGTLAGALVLSRSGLSEEVPALEALVILAIVAFPYFLLQFASAFVPTRPWLRILPAVGLVAVGAWTFVEVPLGEERTPSEDLYVLAFLVYFGLVSLAVAVRMWRAGRDQPTLARRRMRTLASAAILLSLALLLAGLATGRPGIALSVQLIAILSTILFGVAFLPPALLRATWRAAEEDELYRAALRLMATTSDNEVADVLLPHVTRVVGGHAATLESIDGTLLGEYGEDRGPAEPLDVTLTRTRLRVWVSPYTPFFGEEEAKLLLRLGLLADLALDRASLLQREQAARSETEAVNAELEAFVYSASHDLKTPLLTILGFLDVLNDERRTLSFEDQSFYLGRMRANARYMQELIGDLLELSRIGRVETTAEPVELGPLLTDIEEGLRATHPDVRLVVEGPLPTITANATRARQLLANLVENAARYGGSPDVVVTVTAEMGDENVELHVADDGEGIPPEHRERVFGVFERLSTAEGGTGIGLAICRKIVTELGGDISFVDVERGADVRVTLPRDLVVEHADAGT